jgi:6-phosphogluconolactonase
MSCTVEVLADKSDLIGRALDISLERIEAAIADHGFCTLALSGGSTPKPLYEALAQQSLPWDKIYIFWGDERYVSPDHPDSNAQMARQAWLNHVDIPESNIYPAPTDAADPAIAAAQYDQAIQNFFQQQANSTAEFPVFDLILLGMGDDGHTASLFPHTDALQVCDRRITVGNKDGQPRLTFTVPLINCARTILFVIAGANKQDALAHVFAPEDSYETYPARFIQPQQGELIWLLDKAAGKNFVDS